MRLRFGDCRFDTRSRRLFRDEREVHLTPKAFALLTTLLERRPEALSKSELLTLVWPDVFVSEESLARLVTEIRTALGDTARAPRYVRTVHGFGYAFAAPVSAVDAAERADAAPPRCWLICGSREFALAEGTTTLGRGGSADIRFDSPRVSRRHARIAVSGTCAVIEDLTSRNGTFVGGTRVSAAATLTDGDEIGIGPFRLTFVVTRPSGETETEAHESADDSCC